MLENWESYADHGTVRYYTRNVSGRFCCDKQGTLTYFEAAEKNRLYQGPFGYRGSGMLKSMQMLTIPEEVRTIGTERGTLCDLIVPQDYPYQRLMLETKINNIVYFD